MADHILKIHGHGEFCSYCFKHHTYESRLTLNVTNKFKDQGKLSTYQVILVILLPSGHCGSHHIPSCNVKVTIPLFWQITKVSISNNPTINNFKEVFFSNLLLNLRFDSHYINNNIIIIRTIFHSKHCQFNFQKYLNTKTMNAYIPRQSAKMAALSA